MGKIDKYDIGFDHNGLARIVINGKMYYIDYNFNKVSEGFKAGKCVGRNIYSLEEVDGCAAYYSFDGTKFNRETKDLGQCFDFENGLALVRERSNQYEMGDQAYYINEDFEIVSPIFKEASLFDNNGFAVVRGFDDKFYVINQNIERISPRFDHIWDPDKDGVMIGITRVSNDCVYEYYQFDGESFVCVSPKYSDATYFKGDIAIVQEENNGKFFAVDKDFQRVSKLYDDMVGVYGTPGVVVAKENGKKIFLTSETMSEIYNTERYNKFFNKLDSQGYDSLLQAFSDFEAEDVENKEVMNDLKVAVKDYLVHNVYRLAYDDVAGSYFIQKSRNAKHDKRINVNKVIKWIDKVSEDAPQRAEELCMLKKGKVLNK